MITVHELPADQLFRIYVRNGEQTHAVLWFRCSKNGDLVTRALSSGRHLHEVKGNFDRGTFIPTTQPEKLEGLTGNDEADHLHLTIHPSVKKPTGVMHGIKSRKHCPLFDLRTLDRLQQVVIHLLATPEHYPIEVPNLKKDGGKYHAILNNVYGIRQPRITFWVSPIERATAKLADADVMPNCFFYGRVKPRTLNHDLLLQAKLDSIPYSQYGDMHILAAPIVEREK